MYKIFGAEISPYSVKVRSWFRYKGIPHAWTPRSEDNMAEYRQYAKLPLIPLVVTPEQAGMQDSTPIIDTLEAAFAEPSVHPQDAVSRFVSVLLEEFADEWGNKWMFHLRWARRADQLSAAVRIAGDADDEARIGAILERMVNRVWFVGSSATTAPIIETSFRDAVSLLDRHLAGRAYLMGDRPAYADFALWGQLYNAWTDPTGASIINGTALNLLAWIQRMLWPVRLGDFEPWDKLAPTLMPFLSTQVGDLFLPWSVANAAAIETGREVFSVDLKAGRWEQKPQKYHAKSLAVLRQKYAAEPDKGRLDTVLAETGCLAPLQAR